LLTCFDEVERETRSEIKTMKTSLSQMREY